jgi:5-methylthioadenosine/S-adenosylhomocysteine deaminase
VGTLEAGKRADFVTIDCEALGIAPTVSRPFHTAVPNLVHSTTGREVRDVFVAGEPILRDGEFADVDPEATIAEAKERANRVFADAEDDWREAGSELVARTDEGWL